MLQILARWFPPALGAGLLTPPRYGNDPQAFAAMAEVQALRNNLASCLGNKECFQGQFKIGYSQCRRRIARRAIPYCS
jgi:hypothetical protein